MLRPLLKWWSNAILQHQPSENTVNSTLMDLLNGGFEPSGVWTNTILNELSICCYTYSYMVDLESIPAATEREPSWSAQSTHTHTHTHSWGWHRLTWHVSAVSCMELISYYIWAGEKRKGVWDVLYLCFCFYALITFKVFWLKHLKIFPETENVYVFLLIFFFPKFQQNSNEISVPPFYTHFNEPKHLRVCKCTHAWAVEDVD